jgi:2,3-bisphosphoglycerate-dependent phosphoglycerate mutase
MISSGNCWISMVQNQTQKRDLVIQEKTSGQDPARQGDLYPMTDEIGVTFLRHGRSRADDKGVHEGRYDSPLTEVGRSQAEKRGQDLLTRGFGYRLIISSPLLRAQETAQIIAKYLNATVETDTDWAEMDNGLLAGLPFDEAATRFPRPTFRNLYERVGEIGESEWDLFERAARAVGKIVNRGPGQYLVVTHGGILHAALRTIFGVAPSGNYLGIGFRFRDLGYARLTYVPKEHRWIVEEFQASV